MRTQKSEVNFEKITGSKEQIVALYNLLKKRIHVISHQKLPSFKDHKNFVLRNPYLDWFLVSKNSYPIGSFYIKRDNSLGLNLVIQDHATVIKIIDFINENLRPVSELPSEVPPFFYINVPYSNTELQKIVTEAELIPIQVSYKL